MTGAADTINVLHVDDQPDLADVAATFLEREDDRIAVRTATGAEEGLSVLADDDVDCIVSDFDMPGTDGLAFLETVREDHGDLPFILYTGKGSEEVASDAISAGVTDYMQKEAGTDQYAVLANRVVNAVEQHRAERAAERHRRRLAELSQSTDDCLWMFDSDWEELLFVSGYEEVWDRPESAIRDDPREFLKGVHPEDRDYVRDAIERLSTGESIDVEFRIVRGDGEQGAVWAKGDPVFDDAGNVVRVVGFTRDVTGRKEQTRRLETLISNLPGIVYRSRNDLDWSMEVVRGNCEALTGYSREEIEDGTVTWGSDVLHPDDRDEVWETVQAAVAEDRPFEVTYRVRTRDGTTRWVWERGRTVGSEDGGEILEGFITDVTERKEREQELEETTTVLSTLVETLPVGVLVEDESREIMAVNDRLFELFGLSGTPPEAVGTDCERLAREVSDTLVDPSGFVSRVDELVETRESVHEEELALRDGRVFTRSHEPIELPGGDGHLWVYRDVTDQKTREERLRETGSRLEALFEQSPDMINIHDGDGNLVDPNPRLLTETGYDEDELTDTKVWELDRTITPDEARAMWEGMDHGDRERFEGAYRRADGTTFPVEVHLRRLALDGDDRFLAISRDISERKERERELERQNERLEEFASVVSHDLRNPLNVATGRLELLEDECDSDQIDEIRRAHDRMETLIEDLLALARNGETESESEPVALGPFCEDCWQNVETGTGTLRVETDRTVHADRGRLKQLFENLVRNAIEHGGEDVTVVVGDVDDGFYVEDDGPGIPSEDRDRVFDAGYSTASEGTGFGLSIVRDVVEAHGWELNLTESDDGGARFEITGVSSPAE